MCVGLPELVDCCLFMVPTTAFSLVLATRSPATRIPPVDQREQTGWVQWGGLSVVIRNIKLHIPYQRA